MPSDMPDSIVTSQVDQDALRRVNAAGRLICKGLTETVGRSLASGIDAEKLSEQVVDLVTQALISLVPISIYMNGQLWRTLSIGEIKEWKAANA